MGKASATLAEAENGCEGGMAVSLQSSEFSAYIGIPFLRNDVTRVLL